MENCKKQWLYVLLALLFGNWGIHNFYARRVKFAILQFVLGISLFFWKGIIFWGSMSIFAVLLFILYFLTIWIIIDIFKVNKDGENNTFLLSPKMVIFCGIGKIIELLVMSWLFFHTISLTLI